MIPSHLREKIKEMAKAWWVEGDRHSDISFREGAEALYELLLNESVEIIYEEISAHYESMDRSWLNDYGMLVRGVEYENNRLTALYSARLAEKDRTIESLAVNGIHTCHNECGRITCVQGRRIDELERSIAAYEETRSGFELKYREYQDKIQALESQLKMAIQGLVLAKNKLKQMQNGEAYASVIETLEKLGEK